MNKSTQIFYRNILTDLFLVIKNKVYYSFKRENKSRKSKRKRDSSSLQLVINLHLVAKWSAPPGPLELPAPLRPDDDPP